MKNLTKSLKSSKTKMNIDAYYQLNVADITIEVIKKSIKNMHIAVYPPIGRVRIAAPKNTTDEAIRLFGVSKLAWIKKHQQKYLAQERETTREYLEGESLMYKGKRYILKIVENAPESKIIIRNKKYLEVTLKSFANPFEVQKQYEDWLRQELKQIVTEKISKWEKPTKLKVATWKIQKMKTRWGSCNKETGNILINFELIKKPIECIDYVVLHEILHLKEKKHNTKFYQLLSQYSPNWKKAEEQLKSGLMPYTKWVY